MRSDDITIINSQVILTLTVEVPPKNRRKFLAFCKKAFPIYESVGNNKMELYQSTKEQNSFVEIGYYRTLKDYKRSESAIENDPLHKSLIKEWRSLLKGPPAVNIYRRNRV